MRLLITGFAALVMFFPGCRKVHRAELFERCVAYSSRAKTVTRDEITCTVKRLSPEESYTLLGVDFPAEGIQPFSLELENNQKAPIYVSAQSISAPLVSDAVIKDRMYTSTYLIGGCASAVSLVYFWPLIPCAVLPGMYYCSGYNRSIDHFMQEYSLRAYERSFCIMPREQMVKLFFVYGWAVGASFDIGVMQENCCYTKFSY